MSSLSYCVFENTSDEMQGALAKVITGDVSAWNEYEVRSVKRLFEQCESFLEYRDDIENALKELEEEGEEDDECEGCRTGDKRICDGMGCPNAYN